MSTPDEDPEDGDPRLGPKRDTSARGRAAEFLATEFLQARGLILVARNIALAGAELDLIMSEEVGGEPTLVFVEVRSRASDDRGHPIESITPSKQAKVRKAATAWLVGADLWEAHAVRFDVVTLTGSLSDAKIEWFQDAF